MTPGGPGCAGWPRRAPWTYGSGSVDDGHAAHGLGPALLRAQHVEPGGQVGGAERALGETLRRARELGAHAAALHVVELDQAIALARPLDRERGLVLHRVPRHRQVR